MWNRSTSRGKHPFVGLISLLILLFTLVACGSNGQTVNTGTSGNASDTTPTGSVKLGPQPCPGTVSTTQYWDAVVPTQPLNNKVESVMCASLMGTSALQALVAVRSVGSGRALDIHVYNNIMAPKPDEVLKLQNLLGGDAKISGYNTIITGEVDQSSQINKRATNANLTVDLFREFKWFDTTHAFYPVAFPGLFPELTRYEAESDQQKVNQGQQAWQLDAAQVATRFANTYLKWSLVSGTTVESGGHNGDGDAIVTVKSSGVGNPVVKVSLSRLENNTKNGIWIVKNTVSDGLTIGTPANMDVIVSPVTVTGKGNAFEGAVGQAFVLDHLSEQIGQAQVTGNTTFSTNVSFQATFTNGDEEGIVVVYAYSNADGAISGAAMTKVLLH
jgi:Immunoglobulin-like domain of bacterial spore germination